jgi:large subunit ribosomal protein L4
MATTKKITDAEEVKTPKVEKTSKTGGFSVTTYSLIGKEAGSLELPKSIFDGEVNKALIAQAIRVYTNNEKGHFSNTKTRGEVTGSTRKIYKQKGTGRARHGSIMAPIFVGGGIALGPKSRITNMELPKKMKKAALIAALREKYQTKELSGVDLGKLAGKTKEVGGFLKGVNDQSSSNKKTALIVVGEANEMVQRATRNVKGLSVMTADEINVFEVIKHQSIFINEKIVEKDPIISSVVFFHFLKM